MADAWKLTITTAFVTVVVSAYVLLIWMNLSMVVSRCRGDKSRIYYAILWTSSQWPLFSRTDTLHERYGVSKEDMKIILEHQFFLALEGLAFGAVVLAVGYQVMMLWF